MTAIDPDSRRVPAAPDHGVYPASYIQVKGGKAQQIDAGVIAEVLACIHVNGHELASFMCTPHRLDDLAIGFLRSEGLIEQLEDIDLLTFSGNGLCVDIWLRDAARALPSRRIITSGCGGGVTFDDLSRRHPPLNTAVMISAAQVSNLMQLLHAAADLYWQVRGVHTSALSDGERLLLVAEDVGRHNTIDRLWGQALQQKITTTGRILVASGRISSEMLNKAAKMEIPIIISRTSPTSLSIELAHAWNITVIGYARGEAFRIYSAPERVRLDQ